MEGDVQIVGVVTRWNRGIILDPLRDLGHTSVHVIQSFQEKSAPFVNVGREEGGKPGGKVTLGTSNLLSEWGKGKVIMITNLTDQRQKDVT